MGCGGSKGKEPSPGSSQPGGKGGKGQETGSKMVMGRYQMHMDKASMMGQGSFSVCRKGTDTKTNKTVAVKVYKSSKQSAVTLLKFQRQIEVLQELLEPFHKPDDRRYWTERLETTEPKHIFMELLDFSKGADGKPGPDAKDGVMYVITEIAQYSLKDYLALRRQQHSQSGQGLSKPSVKNITEAILHVMAGLHAKGLVHIDMKPENMMMFDGKLKLIDVDGCVKVGTPISITDSSISFSPCYCAPEWAKFLINESDSTIVANPALDVWSVGMTICELVTLDAVLKPMYASFLQNSNRSHQEAGFLFMEWLSSVKKAPTPKSIDKFDKELQDLVVNWLCDPNKDTRKTCSEALSHPYVKKTTGLDSTDLRTASAFQMPGGGAVDHQIRNRLEDEEDATIHKSTLFKLNTGKKPDDAAAWLQRDIWITPNGNLCYWSQKDNKKLILINASRLHRANINPLMGAVKEFAFEIETFKEDEEGEQSDQKDSACFAATSAEDRDKWIDILKRAAEQELVKTFRLGAKMAEDLQKFRIAVKNRRMKVEADGGFDAVFKGKLWKLKGEGDPKLPDHWFLRDFEVAKNGSLTYWSAREERQLVYYTAQDVSTAAVAELKTEGLAKPFTFTFTLPPAKGVEFEPGCFAAETADMLVQWFDNLAKAGTTITK